MLLKSSSSGVLVDFNTTPSVCSLQYMHSLESNAIYADYGGRRLDLFGDRSRTTEWKRICTDSTKDSRNAEFLSRSIENFVKFVKFVKVGPEKIQFRSPIDPLDTHVTMVSHCPGICICIYICQWSLKVTPLAHQVVCMLINNQFQLNNAAKMWDFMRLKCP